MNLKKHIILIDDDQMIHMACEMMLFGSNYKQTSIIDPDEAMIYQQSKDKYDKPDVIIVDFMMGKVSGIDVIKSIRTDPSFDKIPILLFTGYHEKIKQDIELLKKLNINLVLPKPLSREQLLSALDACVDF